MKKCFRILLSGSLLVLFSSSALADDLEGRIESINKDSQAFVVQGIEFFVNQSTDYDDGLRSFDNLEEGQKVEVDFQYREGKHYATEIEIDD